MMHTKHNSKRHNYYVTSDGDDTTHIIVVPEGSHPDGWKPGYRQIPTKDAEHLAVVHLKPNGDPLDVVVHPCSCGEDMLSTHAKASPTGRVASRIGEPWGTPIPNGEPFVVTLKQSDGTIDLLGYATVAPSERKDDRVTLTLEFDFLEESDAVAAYEGFKRWPEAEEVDA